jgi:hypothetical protein
MADRALAIELADQDASILLDWVNMSRFELVGDEITFTFTDAPRANHTEQCGSGSV